MTGSPEDAARGKSSPGRRWYLDWRVWLGLGVTVGALWFAMRDVPLDEVREAMAHADFLLMVVVSVPSYYLAIYVRALRWRQLTESIAPMERSVVFRAMAIGFMVNNLLPLRLGELVRSWYLARETGTRVTAVLGTVVLERVIDVCCVLAMAGVSLALLGDRFGEGSTLAEGARLLAPVGIVPLIGLVALRVVPEWVIRVLHWLSTPLPDRISERLEQIAREFVDGLGALSGGAHLFWIGIHSVTIWLLFSSIPIAIGLVGFGLEMGTVWDLAVVSWAVQATVGVAVALPSAPGFFGTYQLAFKALLSEIGVDPAVSLAVGLLVWFIFWASLVVLGLAVLRLRGTSLGELTRDAGKDPTPDRR